MADIMSVLYSSYTSAAATTPTYSHSKYVAVDPKTYEGKWSGQYSDGSKFSVTIMNVKGFRATARFQSGSTVSASPVLIKDSSFHIGDSKFILTGTDKATLSTAVTNPVSGNVSVKQGTATRS